MKINADAIVSIHAPARGATNHNGSPLYTAHCFNPRPRTGGDAAEGEAETADGQFQSTPPHGGRLRFQHPEAGPAGVSIHAPARGATAAVQPGEVHPAVSIHAPARGATYHRNGADATS